MGYKKGLNMFSRQTIVALEMSELFPTVIVNRNPSKKCTITVYNGRQQRLRYDSSLVVQCNIRVNRTANSRTLKCHTKTISQRKAALKSLLPICITAKGNT